jgi:hypothetical protein
LCEYLRKIATKITKLLDKQPKIVYITELSKFSQFEPVPISKKGQVFGLLADEEQVQISVV